MEHSREHIRPRNREVIFLQERCQKAAKDLLLYAICVALCGILYFGWLRFYWPDFIIRVVIIAGPWCVAMLIVNLIRWIKLKVQIRAILAREN